MKIPHFVFSILLAALCVFSFNSVYAEGTVDGLVLAKAPVNQSDMESIKRGAKLFATNCLSCHTLIYLRYNKVAKEAGITYEKMPINVTNWPNGVVPPDLSLEADVRGVDWIYTYLHSFYKDPARPTGANNLLVPNTAMPNIVGPYQGEQELAAHPIYDLYHNVEWYDLLVLKKQGVMKPEEFDLMATDVVNFLAYAAAPYEVEQHRIGFWVILFLCVMFVMLYFLKKEYWKDVKKHKK
jgi:ubiquinol-cytochrome c reductase cytochrome c1 subunit